MNQLTSDSHNLYTHLNVLLQSLSPPLFFQYLMSTLLTSHQNSAFLYALLVSYSLATRPIQHKMSKFLYYNNIMLINGKVVPVFNYLVIT
jgi:hypothetical protein